MKSSTKFLFPFALATTVIAPIILSSCAPSSEKDKRDQTDDEHIAKVEIPKNIEVNKSFIIKVTLKDNYVIDGNATSIKIQNYKLNFAAGDFTIENASGNGIVSNIKIKAEKVTSATDIVVKVVSKQVPIQTGTLRAKWPENLSIFSENASSLGKVQVFYQETESKPEVDVSGSIDTEYVIEGSDVFKVNKFTKDNIAELRYIGTAINETSLKITVHAVYTINGITYKSESVQLSVNVEHFHYIERLNVDWPSNNSFNTGSAQSIGQIKVVYQNSQSVSADISSLSEVSYGLNVPGFKILKDGVTNTATLYYDGRNLPDENITLKPIVSFRKSDGTFLSSEPVELNLHANKPQKFASLEQIAQTDVTIMSSVECDIEDIQLKYFDDNTDKTKYEFVQGSSKTKYTIDDKNSAFSIVKDEEKKTAVLHYNGKSINDKTVTIKVSASYETDSSTVSAPSQEIKISIIQPHEESIIASLPSALTIVSKTTKIIGNINVGYIGIDGHETDISADEKTTYSIIGDAHANAFSIVKNEDGKAIFKYNGEQIDESELLFTLEINYKTSQGKTLTLKKYLRICVEHPAHIAIDYTGSNEIITSGKGRNLSLVNLFYFSQGATTGESILSDSNVRYSVNGSNAFAVFKDSENFSAVLRYSGMKLEDTAVKLTISAEYTKNGSTYRAESKEIIIFVQAPSNAKGYLRIVGAGEVNIISGEPQSSVSLFQAGIIEDPNNPSKVTRNIGDVKYHITTVGHGGSYFLVDKSAGQSLLDDSVYLSYSGAEIPDYISNSFSIVITASCTYNGEVYESTPKTVNVFVSRLQSSAYINAQWPTQDCYIDSKIKSTLADIKIEHRSVSTRPFSDVSINAGTSYEVIGHPAFKVVKTQDGAKLQYDGTRIENNEVSLCIKATYTTGLSNVKVYTVQSPMIKIHVSHPLFQYSISSNIAFCNNLEIPNGVFDGGSADLIVKANYFYCSFNPDTLSHTEYNWNWFYKIIKEKLSVTNATISEVKDVWSEKYNDYVTVISLTDIYGDVKVSGSASQYGYGWGIDCKNYAAQWGDIKVNLHLLANHTCYLPTLYEERDDRCGYIEGKGNLIVPDYVSYNGERYYVRGITSRWNDHCRLTPSSSVYPDPFIVKGLYFEDDVSHLQIIDDKAFHGLDAFTNYEKGKCYSGQLMMFPEGLQIIGEKAFTFESKESIMSGFRFPSTLQMIGNKAFEDIPKMSYDSDSGTCAELQFISKMMYFGERIFKLDLTFHHDVDLVYGYTTVINELLASDTMRDLNVNPNGWHVWSI